MAPWFLLGGLVAMADPGTEIVLILDNSCSMVAGGKVVGTGQRLPPNDPERAAVLGTLLVEGLARGSEDQLTVIGFGDNRGAAPRVVQGGDAIRELPYGGGTWFDPALRAARTTLDGSARDRRLLILFTDGTPSDLDSPQDALKLIGPHQRLALGLYGSDDSAQMGQRFLSEVVALPADLTMLDARRPDVVQRTVEAFTSSYARLLGSRPETGILNPGGAHTFEVGRYVTEVLIATASVAPGGAYTAKLVGPGGDVPARAVGDNGCPRSVAPGDARTVCDPPRRHYTTFRGANDPYAASQWTLSVPGAPGDVQYGVILRYDLVAELTLPPTARVGDAVPIEGRLLFRGQVFQDDAFFTADAFKAALRVDGAEVPLEHVGAGRFQGVWRPEAPGPRDAALAFTTTWMETVDQAPISVEGFLDLTLRPTPNPIELGAWRGERGSSRRCAEIDLSGSVNADRVAITCTPAGSSADATLTCGPVPGSEATVDGRPGQPLRWEVCVVAAPCCGALPAADDAAFTVTLQGAHAHYAPGAVTVPVRYAVQATGLWRCWWVEISLAIAALVGGWILWGLVSPHSFDPAASARLAGNEAALRRASALVLCEQPGGRRGFYRHARAGFNGEGTPVRDVGAAVLVIEAGPRGSMRFRKAVGLERMDRRTRKWGPVPPEDLALGPETNTTYRLGGVWLRFG
jgi:hypothetical protein